MKRLALLTWMTLSACGAPPPVVAADAGAWWDGALGSCLVQAGEPPRTISQMVERINALPRPVSVACVIAGLPRPLSVVASTSVFSAQPAEGRRSPRIFILNDALILSVVPEGTGAKLLEFGQVVTAGRTLKGELPFPVTGALAPTAPFTQVLMGTSQSNCGLCHRAESPHPTIADSFVSAAFKPDPGNLVPLSELRAEQRSCDPQTERPRCELLTALLAFGTVVDGKFPSQFELFIQ